jgi:hypothetical protein
MKFPEPTQDEKIEGWEISPDFIKAVCDRFVLKYKNGTSKPSIEIVPCEINDLLEVVEEALFWFDRK